MRALALSGLLVLLCAGCQQEKDTAVKTEVKSETSKANPEETVKVDSLGKGIRSDAFKYLLRQQNPDGTYGGKGKNSPLAGKTAVVIYAFSSSQRKYKEADGPFISKAVDYIVKSQNEDGSFGNSMLKKFETEYAVLALKSVNPKAYAGAIANGEKFLSNPALKGFAKYGEFATLFNNTVLPKIAAKEDSEWMIPVILDLGKKQVRGKDIAPEYGSFLSTGIEKDPVVATAFAAMAADRIKDYYSKLRK